MFSFFKNVFNSIISFFSGKDNSQDAQPSPTEPAPVPEPDPVNESHDKQYHFRWNNKEYDKYLVDALKKSDLTELEPKDKNEFGPEPDPIWFWGKILTEMAYYESKWDTSTKYEENFEDRHGDNIWSRGLFQLSIESGRGYDRSLRSEESLHDPKVNIELAVLIMETLVKRDNKIAGYQDSWKGGARYWSVLRGTRDYTLKALKAIKAVNQVPEEPIRDNDDIDKPDDGGDDRQFEEYDLDEEKKWYPKAIRYSNKMRTRGYYKNKYPQGAVIHFTAGRSRNKNEGGSRNASDHKTQASWGVGAAVDRGSYAYFVIDRSGNVHQAFSLDRWGYHAGESAWSGLSGSVSDELVGIEMQNAGRLYDYWKDGNGRKHKCPEGYLASWFSRPDLGDKLFSKEKECRWSDGDDNILKGWYQSFSKEQEKALEELLLWLKVNDPDVFSLDYVLGHDEVSGPKGIGRWRKNDPGAALSSNMTTFRDKLSKEYIRRYG